MGFSVEDSFWMARALHLAAEGRYSARPNPMVGCVIVKDGQLLGEGYHQAAGTPHAEVHALRAAGSAANGATAYVTLEPCAHFGRTPPCADALIRAGLGRVVAAITDPDPRVSGQGLERLRVAGIRVDVGLMQDEAAALNRGFLHRVAHGRPWVRSKVATSLDGKTALRNGQSQWITGPEARRDVQQWRARAGAILTGAGTILADDPLLTVRDIPVLAQPLRVIVDTTLRTPPTAAILASGPVLIATASADRPEAAALGAHGAEIVELPGPGEQVDLAALLTLLARRGINDLWVEAGATLNGALLEGRLVNQLVIYMAPLILGDAARGLAALVERSRLSDAVRLGFNDIRQVGGDLRIVADVEGV